MAEVRLIEGDEFSDARGVVRFVNEADISDFKRFYIIEQSDLSVVRAWQGHKVEEKLFFPLSGKFKIGLISVDNWENPSKKLPITYFALNAGQNRLLHIPGGYATAIQAIDSPSSLLIFSSLDIERSKLDDYRYPSDFWTF